MPREHFPTWGAQNSKFSFYLPGLGKWIKLGLLAQFFKTLRLKFH